MRPLLAAIDIGTGSARAGIFRPDGTMLGRAERPIETLRLSPFMASQDSEAIWRAAAAALRAAMAEAAASRDDIAALAFDATCSLVFRSAGGAPVGTLPGEAENWDTILWLDHRASEEAYAFDATAHPALGHVGGAMSPEMPPPKILWMKHRMPEAFAGTGLIFDLADFLSWRATGSTARSAATLTCKWFYLDGWPSDFFAGAGIADLPKHAGITSPPVEAGGIVGRLTPEAARDLGLAPGTLVGAGMIDAYAGALAVLGAGVPGDLALIAGTSTCVMALSAEPRFIPAAWGPFPDVPLPGEWALEVGQSVSGALLDRLLTPAGGAPPDDDLRARVAARLAELRRATPDLAPDLHILPDFHGNRSPLGRHSARGTITGVDMGRDFDTLVRLYWRGAVALALGLREMVEHLAAHGTPAARLLLAGGHARDETLIGLYADATGLPVVEPEGDAMLLGTAALAAVAAGLSPDIRTAARTMHRDGRVRLPDSAQADWLARDARVFALMRRHRAEMEALLRET